MTPFWNQAVHISYLHPVNSPYWHKPDGNHIFINGSLTLLIQTPIGCQLIQIPIGYLKDKFPTDTEIAVIPKCHGYDT